MRRSSLCLPVVLVITLSCGGDSTAPRHAPVTGSARFFNGATPGAPGTAANFSRAVAPSSGTWLLSPDKITLTLKHISLFPATTVGSEAITAQDVNCTVVYDKSQPGLTQLADCPFAVDTGTYTGMGLTFDGSMQMLINDATNGFYTTATGIVTTPPAGGAVPFTFTFPNNVNGTFQLSPLPFLSPITIADATPPSVSIVVNGLQFFRVTVNGSTVTLGGGQTNEPQRPDIVAAAGSLAKVEFYSRQNIATGNSFCAFFCSTSNPQGIMSVGVYYTDATHPTMIGLAPNGSATNCTNLGLGFLNSTKAYTGLDAAGNIAWAVPTDGNYSGYAAEMRMARVSTIGGTTTLYCKNRTGDPAPAGGSYASGAPAIATAANSLGTYVLVGK